uniref:hypothetical protein n=1 Tax=Marinobacter sp. TaxID=50741 RepID=UPI0035C694D9
YLSNVACFAAVSVSLLAALLMGLRSFWGYFLALVPGPGPDTPNDTPTYRRFLAVENGTVQNKKRGLGVVCMADRLVMTRLFWVFCVPVKSAKNKGKITEN